MDYLNLIQNCDELLRKGLSSQVLEKVKNLNIKNIPARHRRKIANLAWRSEGILLALKILSPVVNSEQAQVRKDVSDQDLVEYCVLLQKIGSVREALEKLSLVDESLHPKALLYKCFCYINEWRYPEAIPLLSQYMEHPEVTDYDRFVGAVNLLSAYIAVGDLEKTLPFSQSLMKDLKQHQHHRLLGNCLEMMSQAWLEMGELDKAISSVEEAAILIGGNATVDQLFVKKWTLFTRAIKTQSIEGLSEFKQEATRRGHWGTAREADLCSLKIQFDPTLFNQLIYGTPYEGYRQRVLKQLNYSENLQARCVIGGDSPHAFDLFYGTLNQKEIIKPGKKIHQLVYFLSSDHYKFQPFGSIYSHVFPEEYFDAHSAPNKIHQLIKRSRDWIKKSQLPLSIEEFHGAYKLQSPTNFAMVMDLKKTIPQLESIMFHKLVSSIAKESFTFDEIMKTLQIPKTSAFRFVKWAVENKKLQKNSAKRNSVYSIYKEINLQKAS